MASRALNGSSSRLPRLNKHPFISLITTMKHTLRSPRLAFICAALAITSILTPAVSDLSAADLTTARSTSTQSAAYISVPMAAATTIYAGNMVCVNTSGYAVSGSLNTANYLMMGVATQTVVNAGSAGAKSIRLERGLFKFDNSSAAAVDVDDIGKPVFIEDNHTLADSTSNGVVAGLCTKLDVDGVWVDSRLTVNPSNAEARTATSDGLTTGIISDQAAFVSVTSANANNIITLPAPTPGRAIIIDVGATGFELRSSAPASIAINGGSGSAAESAIAANSTVLVVCLSNTAWKAIFLDADSDVAKVEAAAP